MQTETVDSVSGDRFVAAIMMISICDATFHYSEDQVMTYPPPRYLGDKVRKVERRSSSTTTPSGWSREVEK